MIIQFSNRLIFFLRKSSIIMSTYDYDELKLNMLSQNGVTFVNDHEKTLHHS